MRSKRESIWKPYCNDGNNYDWSSLGGSFWHLKQNVLKSPPYEAFNLVLKLTENNRDSLKSYFDKGKLGHWAKERPSFVWKNFTLLKQKNENCKSGPWSIQKALWKMETQLGAYKLCLKILLVNTVVLSISTTYICMELNSPSSACVVKMKVYLLLIT